MGYIAAMSKPAWMITVATLQAALVARDRERANAAVASLLAAQAPLGEQWRGIAELMRISGELTLAHRAVDAFVAASDGSVQARYAKVVLLTQTSRLREAHALMLTLPDAAADRGARDYLLGNTALTLGMVDEGRAALEACLRERPGWGPAWLSLSGAIDLAHGPLGDRLLADASAAERTAPADLARFCYALGKLHHDRGDHAAAFAAYARGAGLLRGLTPYSPTANAANATAAMTGFDGDLLARARNARGVATSRPIFVTGLPRSGTTLVEQILASHSAVADGAELNAMHHVAVHAGGLSGESVGAHVARGGSLDGLAALYLHLASERLGTAGRFVDKTIDNSRFLGLIAAALPDAPLIWMRRDPLDSAWACFHRFFVHGVAWSYDLGDIAHHFTLEDRLLDFWQARLGDRLLVVPYAALVDDPPGWTRRLLAHCGLADEASVHTPHLTQRAVATASALQVRRPLNRDGLGVAQPYRRWLGPFIDAYAALSRSAIAGSIGIEGPS